MTTILRIPVVLELWDRQTCFGIPKDVGANPIRPLVVRRAAKTSLRSFIAAVPCRLKDGF
ncbi:MAG: hypothetical protein JO235_00255 [Chroococcidiopsidaceae cyanobacterium CP_BM_RX_35]|nr:hypothetical protein [Chroococcidiopsidaceae cyanobacterium CP_BM_RX_35]